MFDNNHRNSTMHKGFKKLGTLNPRTNKSEVDEANDDDDQPEQVVEEFAEEFLDFEEEQALLEAGGKVDDNMEQFVNKYG